MALNDRETSLIIVFVIISIIGGGLLVNGMANQYVYTIEDVTVDYKFVNEEYREFKSGFLSGGIEYYYDDGKMVLNTSQTYKVKIKLDNNFDRRYIEYIYS